VLWKIAENRTLKWGSSPPRAEEEIGRAAVCFGELLNREINPNPVKHKPNGLDENGVPLIDLELSFPINF
jgi:hypothetical protein